MNAEPVRVMLREYLSRFPQDRTRLATTESILPGGAFHAPISRRLPTHITTSALLMDELGRVLEVRHRHLGRWLFPGGHVEAGDRSLLSAAQRELTEEAGVTAEQTQLVMNLPIDIDVHSIPARADRGEAAHVHCDFRFLFKGLGATVILAQEEVTEYRWRDTRELGQLGERIGEWWSR